MPYLGLDDLFLYDRERLQDLDLDLRAPLTTMAASRHGGAGKSARMPILGLAAADNTRLASKERSDE